MDIGWGYAPGRWGSDGREIIFATVGEELALTWPPASAPGSTAAALRL